MVADYHELQVLDLIKHLLWYLKENLNNNYKVYTLEQCHIVPSVRYRYNSEP